MGRIQSDVGLVTGLNIGDTVTKLMALEAKPRDLLVARTKKLQDEQTALTELTTLLVSTEYVTDNLGKTDLYSKRAVSSSNSSVLAATVTGTPALGTYQYTALRMARSQQLMSRGVASDTEPIGAGTFTFRFGAGVDRTAAADMLGQGSGFVRGKIRITDRSGTSAEIDLTTAQSLDDVLDAINRNTQINVSAVAHGDGIRLIDNTGATTSNLKVQEIGTGRTAASLGLAGLNASASVADGQAIVRLSSATRLSELNDGTGFNPDRVVEDVNFQLRDGTTGTINFSPIISGSSSVDKEVTLGDVVDVINQASPGKLKAEIDSDGLRLKITDLTTGSSDFTLTAAFESPALRELGLDSTASNGVITGRRIVGGAKTVLMSSLNGGQGYGSLGEIQLTDRSGATATVDLAGAETLDEVLDRINASGLGISAGVNQARNGITLTDTTGQTTSNLIIASADGTGSAEKLGLAANVAGTSKNSGDLHLAVVGRGTRLSALNGGAGVARGTFTITDTNGVKSTVDLRGTSINTVDDVLVAINRAASGVHAELNATGDGIVIRDTAHGALALKVEEGGSTTAADLHLVGGTTTVDVNGTQTQVVNGATTYSITLDSQHSLAGLAAAINSAGGGLTATVLNDGSGTPYRLSLTSQRAGAAGELLIDTSSMALTLDETVSGQDALIALGDASSTGTTLVSSASNTFSNVMPGAKLEIKGTSTTPVSVTVQNTQTDLMASLRLFVTNYNKFRTRLQALTAYDSEAETRAILNGTSTALRLDQDMSQVISGASNPGGTVRSLAQLGVSIDQDGSLTLDEDKFNTLYESNPDGIKQFFTTATTGFSARMHSTLEQLSGVDNSLLTSRLDSLATSIEKNSARADAMKARLEKQTEALYLKFYNMELAISKMKASLNALSSVAYIDSSGSTSSS